MKPKKLYDSYQHWHLFIILLLVMLIFRLVGFTSADMRRQVQDRHQYSAEDLLEAVCEYQSLTEDERKDVRINTGKAYDKDKITYEEYSTIWDRIYASEELEKKRKDIKLEARRNNNMGKITDEEYDTIIDVIEGSGTTKDKVC